MRHALVLGSVGTLAAVLALVADASLVAAQSGVATQSGTPAPESVSPETASPETPMGSNTPGPAPVASPTSPPEDVERASILPSATAGASDHAGVVGHFGVGFFGIQTLVVTSTDQNPLLAPTLGARYWLTEGFGLEAGLGLAFAGGNAKNNGTDPPTRFGVALHAAVPLVFMHRRHYKFLVIPELNLGIGSGKDYGATSASDIKYSSFLLEVGARVGAEVHFGFIGVPELSLQGTVGMHVAVQDLSRNRSDMKDGVSTIDIRTSVQDAPWNIFIANVAAIYYL